MQSAIHGDSDTRHAAKAPPPAAAAAAAAAAGATAACTACPPSRAQALEARTPLRNVLFGLSRAMVCVEELPVRQAKQQGMAASALPRCLPLPRVG